LLSPLYRWGTEIHDSTGWSLEVEKHKSTEEYNLWDGQERRTVTKTFFEYLLSAR
jgi:hypothetical protein